MRGGMAAWGWGVVGLALAVRLLLLWAGGAEPGRLLHEPDSSGYETLALNLLAHGRFSLEDRPPFRADHTRTPVYPALLAALYAVTGRQPAAAGLLSAFAGAATVAALVFAGRRLIGPAPALLAGAVLAVDPTSAGYSVLLLTEPFFTLLLTVALLGFLAGLGSGRTSLLGGSGVWLGLASLTRPIGLYLPLLLGGALALRRKLRWRRALGGAGILLLGTALLTTPWALRNLITGERFELSSIGAVNLYYHRAAAVVADAAGTSRDAARHRLAARLEARAAAEHLSEADTHRLMAAWAMEIIGSDLGRYARLHLEGIGRMLGPDPRPLFQLLGWLGPDARPLPGRQAHWRGAVVVEGIFLGGLYLAAFAGVWEAVRGGRGWSILPAVLAIGYAFLVGGPEVYPRFRVPLMPWFAWLAGLGLASVVPGLEGHGGDA